jgi:Skp family chaperone for outer membrane proteins
MGGRSITYAGVAVIVLLLFTAGYAFISQSKTKQSLNDEKLRSEKLLSEKLCYEKDLDRLNTDIAELKADSDAGSKLLAETETRLAESENSRNALTREVKSLRATKREFETLKTQKEALDREYAGMQRAHEKLLAENSLMQKSVTELEAGKNDLLEKLNNNELYDADNYIAYGTRGKKDKLSLRASRTKKLVVNFDVPQSLTEAISFRLTTPSGTTVTPDDKSLSWNVMPDPASYTASLTAVAVESGQSRQVVLSYAPTEKLMEGEYKIGIECNGRNIGNCRLRLQ